MESIIVIGRPRPVPAEALAGSVDLIGREELEYEHVDDTTELFSKLPGVSISRFNQGIINSELLIRGFAGDGESPHAKLLIDGIPSNLHDGLGEMDQVFPLAIESIQVFKGTSDVRYGLLNTAGSYRIESRSALGGDVEVTLGSYGAREAQGYYGFALGKLTQSYFLGYREANGYRDHTDLQKVVGTGRWSYAFSDDTRLGFAVRIAEYEGDAPGYLSRAAVRRRPKSSEAFANQDGGEKDTNHYAVNFETELVPGVSWNLRAYAQTFERERFVRFSAAGALQNRHDDQRQDGVLATLTWNPFEEWTLRVGADYEAQDNVEQRFGTVGQSRKRDPGNVLRDFEYELDTLGGFASLENTLGRFVRWNAGVRLDHLDGDFAQTDGAGLRSERDIFGFGTIVQPKLNLFVSPVEQLTLFANYGRSFQHPFGSSLYASSSADRRDVSLNDGWEAGIQWKPERSLDLRVSLWEQRASDEFVSIDGTLQNVGRTRRRGIDIAAGWSVSDALYLWGNYSAVDTKIVRTGTDRAANRGNALRSVPEFTASLGMTYAITDALRLRLHLDAQGDYFVNEANRGGKFGNYTLLNAGLEYDTGWGAVRLQVNNLFNRRYEYVFDFSQDGTDTIHSPGDGINANVSARYRF